MDMDSDIANWILDFYLRQPLHERTLNSLLRSLPPPIEDPNLQKLLLLKKLELVASRCPISEIALQIMEQLEELEFRHGNKAVSEVMRRAYCAVAVDCTVKFGHQGSYNGKYEFLQTVKRVWWEKIGIMEKNAAEGGLGSELLWEWRDMMDVAVFDDGVYEDVLKKFEEVDAVGAVRDYVREEREKMGPSFLEMVHEEMKNNKDLQKIMAVENTAASGSIHMADALAVQEMATSNDDPTVSGSNQKIGNSVAVEDLAASPVDPAATGSNQNKDMHNRRVKLRHKLVGLKHPRTKSSNISRGARIVDSDGKAGEPSCMNNSSPHGVKVNLAREALKLSSSELQAVVKDPLPDAVRVAETILNETGQGKQQGPIGGNDGRPETVIVDAAGVVRSNDVNQNTLPKPSIMERNSSACTYEWDDSIDGSQEDIARKAIRVPSPQVINTSPLRIYQMNSLKMRRKGRKWTPLEEDTLRAGVETYGKGNWKVILSVYRDVFEGRTEVDLKDKWRNMTRYGM